MAKSKAPTGLSIARKNMVFTCSWKIADSNYDEGQRFWYRIKENNSWKPWKELAISANSTSKAVRIQDMQSRYYPNTTKKLTEFEFCVRGKRSGYDESSDSYYSIAIKKPNKPSVSSALTSSNVFKAVFSIDVDATRKDIFTSYEWQTILVHDSNETEGKNLRWKSTTDGWSTGTGTTSTGSKTITEDTTVIAQGSHTRWFRVRARGVAGDSDWVYTKHVYAQPLKAAIKKADAKVHQSGFILSITWRAARSVARPIDRVTVQYAKAVPIANMLPPVNLSWQDAVVAKDTSGDDSASVNISGGLGYDECLFARVVTTHDNRNNYSDVALVKKGKLNIPSGLSTSVNNDSVLVEATNNSSACVYNGQDASVKRLFLAVIYKSTERYKSGIVVGVIPTSVSQTTVTIPQREDNEQYTIGVKAYVGTYTSTVNNEGVRIYKITSVMSSETISTQGATPEAPSNLNVEVLNGANARATWDWTWDKAEGVELSWSQDEDAWESNSLPDTFDIDEYTTSWLIKELEVGKRYYMRARFKSGDDYSPYSDTVEFVTSTAPEKPIISLSDSTIAKTGSVVVSWNYVSTDGSEQSYAEVLSNGQIIAHSLTEKYIKLYAEDLNWVEGTHDLALRVQSLSGLFSEYSDTAYIEVAPEISAEISQTSLENITVTEDGEEREVLSMTELPLTVTVTGAGSNNVTTLEIVRAESYAILRPDEEMHYGYEDELICLKQQTGEDQFSISVDDLEGVFDDGAKYKIIATVQDEIGQIAKDEVTFEVHWTHQAVVPSASVLTRGVIAQITPVCADAESGDVCDIYRLSADKPQLILKDGEFGKTYIDPYPAINGGYRIVLRTVNGDYFTQDETPAWRDIISGFKYQKVIIDFGTDRAELYCNIDSNNSWKKDFIEKKYLGGSIQGDWNSAISRSGNISAVTVNILENDTIQSLRKLAEFAGICNVRTLDGSSYHANVDVSESKIHDKYGMINEFSLSITRVDSQSYDAIITEEMNNGLE